jgi:spore germination cell wall hydrolase CwlJ-like protein
MKNILLSLLLAVGVTVVQAAEVKQETIVLADNTTFSGQVVEQATSFVERTVNLIATPFLSDRDVECLARNIFYESRGEPTEGKIAVGIVTLNRAQDPRFGKSVCDVVKARTVVTKTKEVKKTEMIRVGYFGPPEKVTTVHTVTEQVPVCQFSWVCSGYAKKPKSDDERWIESREIAQRLADGEYPEYHAKYNKAMYFHAAGIRPIWAKSKTYIKRTGQHLFYGEVDK